MGEVAPSPRVVRFGVFEVDLAAGELRRKGMKVRLQEQPLQVLAALLERPGSVVTREELKRKLWAGATVDFDHGLNTTINKLREALGDAADAPRFIETLPRRGYRFVYPINGASRVEPTVAPPAEGAPALGAPADRAPSGEPAAVPSGASDGARGDAVQRAPARRPRLRTAGVAVVALPALLVGLAVLGGLRGRVAGPPAGASIGSIAVLPLKNLSGDPAQDYFAEGMTEGLITELGKIGKLRVLSWASAARYRGSPKPLVDIAREVGVEAVLVGTATRDGESVRVTARLVQASPERQLWEETYDFAVQDVLAIQKALARDVSGRIGVEVRPREEVRLAVARRIDPEAYEAFLLGRAHLARAPSATSHARARAYLEEAIEKDPGYAPAYAALAELQIRARGSPTRSAAVLRVQARQWVEKALELDDTLAEAHATLGRIAQQEWDWSGAEREYRRAVELNPSSAKARLWYAMYLCAMQRFEEAVVEARRAQQLDPASPLVNTWTAATFVYAGREAEAAASWRKALELDPGYADASLVIARTHVMRGEHAEAIAELRRALAFDPRQALLVGALAHAYARAGRRDEALKLVGDLDRMEAEERGYLPPFGHIWAYAGLGDADRAFARLERSYRDRVDRMAWLNVDPLLAPLRSDPRFAALARRLGLPAPGSPGPR